MTTKNKVSVVSVEEETIISVSECDAEELAIVNVYDCVENEKLEKVDPNSFNYRDIPVLANAYNGLVDKVNELVDQVNQLNKEAE